MKGTSACIGILVALVSCRPVHQSARVRIPGRQGGPQQPRPMPAGRRVRFSKRRMSRRHWAERSVDQGEGAAFRGGWEYGLVM